MRLARKHDHSRRTLQKLERAEQLLSARVLRSAVVRLPQNKHYGGVDFLDERNRGAVGVVLRVLKRWRLEPVRLEQGEIGRIPPRGPIRYVALRYRGGKAVGLGNRRVRQYPPATAAGHPEFFGIDVAALEDFIHSRHQVAVVVTRIVVLNDVAEILSVAGRAARVDVKYHVALSRHPLKFVIEDPAIGRVWPAVDVENQRIFFLRIEVGWLLNPSLTWDAVEALVINFFRFSEVELRQEGLVRIGDAGLRAVLVALDRHGEQVPDRNRRRDQGNNSARFGRDREIEYGLIAMSNFGDCARLCVHTNQRSASLLGYVVEEPAPVRRPVECGAVATAWGRIVAEHGTAHVEVVARSEIAGLRIRREVHDPEIRLRVGTDGLRDGTMEGDASAVGAEREIANSHGNGSHLFGRTSRHFGRGCN